MAKGQKPAAKAASSSSPSSAPPSAGDYQQPRQVPFAHINSTPDSSNPLVDGVRSLLGRSLKIELVDGRTVVGSLVSLDNHINIVLHDTYQAHIKVPPTRTHPHLAVKDHLNLIFRSVTDPVLLAASYSEQGSSADQPSGSTRQMGQILVPGTAIVKIFLAKEVEPGKTPD